MSSSEVGRKWIAELGDRDWAGACRLRVDPKPDCAESTQRAFEGGTVRLLEPGAYRDDDDETTDNVTRYAIETTGGARVTFAYFEVVKWGDDFRVDLQLTIEGAR